MAGKPLRWIRADQLPAFAGAFGGPVAAAIALTEVPVHDPPLAPRDEAVFLLHIAAEIEHALLVQYLYAAYSLKPKDEVPGAGDWRRDLVKIAKEEMGHLITVQNLLRVLGGPITLDREDFPFRSELYPFEFTLERLTRGSLAKYVAAERPDNSALPQNEQAELDDILEVALNADPGGHGVNRVGALYFRLINLFERLDPTDFRFDAGTVSQEGTPNFWRGQPIPVGSPSKLILVGVVASKDQAIAALQAIARQGEGLAGDPSTDSGSHFHRFRDIYRALVKLPDHDAASSRVATNPTASGSNASSGAIENQQARGWAQVFNLRYRLLLTVIGHSLMAQKNPADADVLKNLIHQVMPELRDISDRLTALPLNAGNSSVFAGPPFELPFTLTLPEPARDRWRIVLDIIDAIADRIGRLLADFPTDTKNTILTGIRDEDADIRNQVAVLAEVSTAPPVPPSPLPPPVTPPITPPTTPGFARVKQILDGAIAAWKAANGNVEPKLTQRHHNPTFGWATKEQLANSAPLGFKLIEPGVPGKDTNLIKSLRDDDGVDGNGRMPDGGPYLSNAEIAEIISWIDAGMPD
jgi:hypothetical protein